MIRGKVKKKLREERGVGREERIRKERGRRGAAVAMGTDNKRVIE